MGEKKYSDSNWQLYREVGKQISRVRAERTRIDVEELAGIRVGSLSPIESGDTACPLHVLVRLAKVFDCTLDELVSDGARTQCFLRDDESRARLRR